MFYQFKPERDASRSRARQGRGMPSSPVFLKKATEEIRAFAQRHPGIAKLISVLTLAVIGAVLAGMLFYQGIFNAQPTVFRIDLNNTILRDRITSSQGVARQHALDLYLDSLDNAISADSIRNLEPKKSNDDADAQLH
ncbi:hypothetical protein SAMN05216327_11245 [Dyadobacter sp. SG02]|uniref:hypothetical protein n=1 Tax=Dyadobacter sp. SG02 TaxID=1855291 RepID=UPI0008D36CA2|nr:hypothetical protein [Dyadobacter sp. SG02]SEJ52999.1 hypothetical protein SAMN05216327_11245 [Dyadobacter sp. SG02]